MIGAFDSTLELWAFGAVQIFGVAATWLSRVTEGSAAQTWTQWLFMASLLLTGLATVAAPAFGAGYWLLSSATLGTMIVAAVCDFRPQRDAHSCQKSDSFGGW